MRRVLAAVAFVALAAVPSVADVTITVTTSTNAGGTTIEMSAITYIKGMKGRVDLKGMGQDRSILQDVAAKQQLMVNHVTKLVKTFDPKEGMAKMGASMGDPTVSFKPSGQTKEILGRTCTGYTLLATRPMTVGEETFTITHSGLVWLAKGGRDVGEWLAFERVAGAAGMTVSPFGQGPQSQGMTELQVFKGGANESIGPTLNFVQQNWVSERTPYRVGQEMIVFLAMTRQGFSRLAGPFYVFLVKGDEIVSFHSPVKTDGMTPADFVSKLRALAKNR